MVQEVADQGVVVGDELHAHVFSLVIATPLCCAPGVTQAQGEASDLEKEEAGLSQDPLRNLA